MEKLDNKELEDVRMDLLEMGVLVQQCIANSINVLMERDPKFAARVLENCSRIEELEVEIEERCEALFKLQPLSKRDISFAVAFLKITSELRGISRISIDIAKTSKELVEKKVAMIPMDLHEMRKLCEGMLELNLEALRSLDAGLLNSLSENEELMDGMYDQIRRILITHIIEEPRNIRIVEHLRFIAQHLERIGDHIYEIGKLLLPCLESYCLLAESLQ